VKILYFFVILFLSLNGHSFGELSSDQTKSVSYIKRELVMVKKKKDKGFITYLNLATEDAKKLNKEALGFKSTTLDQAATKLMQFGTDIANSFKIKDALQNQNDIKQLADKLQKIDTELSTVKTSLNKKFATEKRQQAANILLEIIKVLEEILDDAIASVPSY
jgi:Na+/phosphate symporter